MTNREFGRASIEDARVIFVEAKASLEQGHFHQAVRKCGDASGLNMDVRLHAPAPESLLLRSRTIC